MGGGKSGLGYDARGTSYATRLSSAARPSRLLVPIGSRAVGSRESLFFLSILRKRSPILYPLKAEVFIECRYVFARGI